jgi:Ni/Co efflux regulator RcnB
MKASFLSILAAASLLATTSFAAPSALAQDNNEHRIQQSGNDRQDDRNNKDFNYGYDKKHKVTSEEKARWEAAGTRPPGSGPQKR